MSLQLALVSFTLTFKCFSGDDKTLFVKNLADTVTEDTLRDFFSPAEIDEIRLPKKRDGGCKGWVLVI